MYNKYVSFLKNNFILIFILILGFILRFWNISNIPPSLTWDEAALGYNAYSIMTTGKDEYGNLLPLTLKSFGDYKPALYAYLTVPFVALLGLNELAVRLPSVIFGTLTVLLIFLLANQLFQKKLLSLSTALFLSISPLHIQFSRGAFEANLAVFFNLLGVYFFAKRKVSSVIFFALSILTYQSSKLFVPLTFLSLIFIYRKGKQNILPFIFLITLILITTFVSASPSRLSTLNLFAYQRSTDSIVEISLEDGLKLDSISFKILHGEWWEYTKGVFERIGVYMSPKILFIDGDPSGRHRVPDLGTLYAFSALLIPLGIYYLLTRHKKSMMLIGLWFVAAIIPAILSRDLTNNLRALNMVIPLSLLEGAGFYLLINKFVSSAFKRSFQASLITSFRNRSLRFLAGIFLSILLLINVFIYLDSYFIHAPRQYSQEWVYGYKQALEGIEDLKSKHEKVVISDKYGQPYIYYLFYTKYSPAKFQKQAQIEQQGVDVGTIRKIDNIEFRRIDWVGERHNSNNLFLGSPEELPDKDQDFPLLKEIRFLDGTVAFRIFSTGIKNED